MSDEKPNPKRSKSGRGGQRPGAGRPPEQTVQRRIVPIALSAEEVHIARKLGGGIIAEGVRRALLQAQSDSAPSERPDMSRYEPL